MRQIKKALCFLLTASLLLLLASCSKSSDNGKNNDNVSDGRYVETDITPPIDGMFMSFLDQDGTIVCFERGLYTRFDSTDGGISWKESPGPGRNTDRYMYVTSGALLQDGSFITHLQDEGLVIIKPDGSSEHYPMPDIDKAVAEGSSVMIMLIQALGNDRLLLEYSIGGMMVQEGRPIGRAPIGQAPAGSEGAGQEPSGQGPISVDGDGDSEGADASGPASNPEGRTQGAAPQRTSGGTSMSMSSMSRQTALYELSSGKLIASLQTEGVTAAASDDESMYLIDYNGSIKIYNLSDGAPSSKPAVNLGGTGSGAGMISMPWAAGSVLAAENNGGIYALYDRNLLLCSAGGNVDTVLEGTAYSIGAPNSSASAAFVLTDGSIILNLLDNMQSNRLYKYSYDENASIDPEKTLTVWSLEDNSFVRAAIAELRKKNPDAYITYEIALSGDNALSPTDAIKTLNTRLLGGTGPDVIILDGCPAESYAGKGMLIDLSELIDTSDIYTNLLAPYISEGKLYSLPAQFIMPALLGSEDALSKARTLEELVSAIVNGNDTSVTRPVTGGGGPFSGVPESERAELYFENVEELCNILWLSCAPDIVSDNKLNNDSLRRYLETIKAISDKYGLAETADENSMGMSVAFASGGRATVLPSSLVRYTSQMTNYGAFLAENLTLMQLIMDREGSHLAAFPGITSGAWRPSTIVGVSADSDVPGFAAELIKAMLSVNVQQMNYGEGLPVTREGVAAQIKELNKNLSESGRDTFDIDMDALIAKLASPSVNDQALTDMMRGSIEKLCAGRIDVEGAVREIEQSIKNYLAERA